MRTIATGVALLAAAGASADVSSTQSFDRYKIIIEKSPFSKGAAAVSSAPAVSSFQGLVLTGIFHNSNTKKVFIRDTKSNQPYYIGEGESILDIKVIKIDPESQTVTLERGLETHTLAFPERGQAPVPPGVPNNPSYGRLLRNVQTQAGVNPPGAAPAAIAPGASRGATPQATSPTSLRRRILRQNLRPIAQPQPAPQQVQTHAPNEAPQDQNEQPAEEETAEAAE